MGCKTAMFDLSVSMNCTKSQACPYVYCYSCGVIQNHTDLRAVSTCFTAHLSAILVISYPFYLSEHLSVYHTVVA